MKLWSILIITSSYLLLKVHAEISCESILRNNCYCSTLGINEYEYQCPYSENIYDSIKNQTIIHVFNDRIHIDCTDVPLFTKEYIPKTSFEELDLKLINLRWCPMYQGGFKHLAKDLGVDLKYLKYEYSKGQNFTEDVFNDLDLLEELQLDGHDFTSLPEDIFKPLPNLILLTLNNNNLGKLPENIFKSNAQLRRLEFGSNALTDFPEDIFEHNEKLEQLLFWNNLLTEIRNDTFKSTKNLSILELRSNKISKIDKNAFAALVNLTTLSLNNNRLTSLAEDIFKNNAELRVIKLQNNPVHLPANIFTSLTNIMELYLRNTSLENLPKFSSLVNLEKLDLGSNKISILKPDAFLGLNNLKVLDLSFNSLNIIEDNVFHPLASLEKLSLRHNYIKIINNEHFSQLTNLQFIDLESNNVNSISTYAFRRNEKLREINMSKNNFSSFGTSPFHFVTSLEILDVSHNAIDSFLDDVMYLQHIKNIDMSYNNITVLNVNSLWKVSDKKLFINLGHNKITYLNFLGVESSAKQQINNENPPSVVNLSSNPIQCDCQFLGFSKYIHNDYEFIKEIKYAFELNYEHLQCAGPPDVAHLQLDQLEPQMLTCTIDKSDFNCTNRKECDCFYRPNDLTMILDCKRKGLKYMPRVYQPSKMEQRELKLAIRTTEIMLEDNEIELLPNMSRYGRNLNISRLSLGRNWISNVSWVPPNIKELHLEYNNLTFLDDSVIKQLNKTNVNLTLGNNPWSCDCEAHSLTDYIRLHPPMDKEYITCNRDYKRKLINLSEKDLCSNEIILASSVIIVLLLFIIALLFALYYRYQETIKIWLYARGYLLWWVKEEELDKDKIYDAFLSFSHHDEDFVTENLMPMLEGGEQPYKICVHYRNWTPGEFIATQVEKSVRDSRRTIVVLSPKFLESVWGKLEFRTAHVQAMSDGRARVILLLYGDIDDTLLDDDLKTYIKTYTYIKWGDPWFWDKLKYALPHANRKPTKNNQQLANMMDYIDSKFKLGSMPHIIRRDDTEIGIPTSEFSKETPPAEGFLPV